MGGELRRVQQNTETDPNARGTFSFTGYSTSNFSNGFPVPGTGYDFADFLLGLPQTTSVRFGVASNYLRTWVTTAFFQDDWRDELAPDAELRGAVRILPAVRGEVRPSLRFIVRARFYDSRQW